MQLDNVAATRDGMQAVDILRNQRINIDRLLEFSKGLVSSIRPGRRESLPAHVTARPITAARVLAAHEGTKLNRLRVLPLAIAVAVIGNA